MTTRIFTNNITNANITGRLLSSTAVVESLGYVPADSNNVTGIDSTARSLANSGIILAQAAFDEANIKFGSTGGLISGNVTITGGNDLTITGNLLVFGNTTYTSTNNIIVDEAMIELANGNVTDIVDIGFFGNYGPGQKYTGFFRSAATNEYYAFYNYDKTLEQQNNTININDSTFLKSNINANYFKGNLIAENVIADTIIIDSRDIYDFGTSAYNQANTAINNTITVESYVNSAAIYANTGIDNAASASLYANLGISLAQAVYDKANSIGLIANTDYTTLSVTPGTYGNSTFIPTITLAANGRVTGITSTAVSNTFSGTLLGYNEGPIFNLGTAGGTISPNIVNGNVQRITLNSQLTINGFANAVAGQSLTLFIYGGTSYTTITSTMKFSGGDKTLTGTIGCIDILTIYYDGTTYFASVGKGFA
jgi:hypothetical protein